MDYITVLIIDMEAVPLIDMSGLVAIKNMILDLQSKNKSIIICGAQAVTTKILQKLPINSRHQVKLVDDLENAVNVI